MCCCFVRILHAKYQLIYTLDSPMPLDSGALRWRVAAAVLTSVARHAPDLERGFGAKALQLVHGSASHEFPESLRFSPDLQGSVLGVPFLVAAKDRQPHPADHPSGAFYLSSGLLAGATEPGENCSTCYHQLCESVARDFLEGAAGFELLLRSEERQSFERCVLTSDAWR